MTAVRWKDKELFCHDLPSEPRREVGRVLVTGASGYVGGRLVPELLARAYRVRVMVRAPSPEFSELWPDAEVVVGDALQPESLRRALEGVDTAYYLIHSLLLGPNEFAVTDTKAAVNFRAAAGERALKRIIYLGGLGDVRTDLSSHLRSRARVADELRLGSVPVTILRAGIIIGSGSASYEIIQHLVRKLRVLPIPRWATNRCEPIGIRDVVKYLVGVLEISETSGMSFDIGSGDVLSYRDMMKTLAEVLGRRRYFVSCPLSSIGFYAYIASLLTPVPAPITRCLMEGLRNDVVCLERSIERFLPFRPLTYRQAIVKAMTREEQDNIHTRWSGAYPPAHELAIKLHEVADSVQYTTSYHLETAKEAGPLFGSICRIGGGQGWFANNWMWRMRGWIDRALLGVGTSRGRRSHATLRVNDVIDFWRIEDLQLNRRLLLRSEMRLPGKAWLEFTIDDDGRRRRLGVTAHYLTGSFSGRAYWYALLPFHGLVFDRLIRQIEKRTQSPDGTIEGLGDTDAPDGGMTPVDRGGGAHTP